MNKMSTQGPVLIDYLSMDVTEAQPVTDSFTKQESKFRNYWFSYDVAMKSTKRNLLLDHSFIN